MSGADSRGEGLIAQLSETWSATTEVCRVLSSAQWARPTACPGWSVKDQVVHMLGTESMLAGRPAPDMAVAPATHIRNEIGELNESWILACRDDPGPAVLDRFVAITSERLAALRALSDDEWEAPTGTPVGRAPYRRFMQIRIFDSWVHEMDINDALGQPGVTSGGAAAEQSVDEVERALGLLIGKRATAPSGSRVTLSLFGPITRDIHVAVNGRAAIVDDLPAPATVTLRMGSPTLLRLACGRVDPLSAIEDGSVTIEGDAVLGASIVAHLPYTI